MATVSQSRWVLQTTTLVVWALAAGSTAYWGLRLYTGRGEAANLPVATAPTAVDSLTVARVLGARAQAAMPQASIASRFVLQGVVAGTPGGGAALIAVDGKPARPFRVGSAVEEGLILQSATARQATLAGTQEGPALVTLDMPPLNK
jgi:general secretion pathway protein C